MASETVPHSASAIAATEASLRVSQVDETGLLIAKAVASEHKNLLLLQQNVSSCVCFSCTYCSAAATVKRFRRQSNYKAHHIKQLH
jgi:hypothetical protein